METQEIALDPEKHAVLLGQIPYLERFYEWEHAQRPDATPTLRADAVFGDASVWTLFVELLFSDEAPLFGYRFLDRAWRFGLLLDYRDAVAGLLDFLGVSKSHRSRLLMALADPTDPPPMRFFRGLPKQERSRKKSGAPRHNRSLYPDLGTTPDEDRLVPSQYLDMVSGMRRHKRLRRHSH